MLDIETLQGLQRRPELFAPGNALFWDDPYISSQMLAAHLDPDTDAASRRPETIQRMVDWLVQNLPLKPGAAVLDLGCGPGLYTERFAKSGLQVSGVDLSPRSIEYAIESARRQGLAIDYRCLNYLTLQDENRYEAAFLIYGDYCPLSPGQRSRLLANVHQSLKPDGFFVLDVTTPGLHQRIGLKNGWYVAEKGFWRPGPHLVLEQGYSYPEELIFLDQYLVIEPDGSITVYRNWFQDYTPESIRAELLAGGFEVLGLWSDLAGAPYQDGSDWIGVIARANTNRL